MLLSAFSVHRKLCSPLALVIIQKIATSGAARVGVGVIHFSVHPDRHCQDKIVLSAGGLESSSGPCYSPISSLTMPDA
jgi:hypothetical protein